jgi:hypothetical protein
MHGASQFIIDNSESTDLDFIPQLLTVKYLLFIAKFRHDGYVSTAELLSQLASQGYTEMNEHQLKSTVISRLRDKNVLISSSNRGYKIPQNYQAILDFVELVNGQTIPLLERLNRVQRLLHKASLGDISVFEQPHLGKLKQIMVALDNSQSNRKFQQIQ